MRVGEETAGVGNDLLDVEAHTSVVHGSSNVDTSGEWAGQAAVGDTALVRSLGVGERNARWSSTTLCAFVNVGSSLCGRRIVAGHAAQGDVLFIQISYVLHTCDWGN